MPSIPPYHEREVLQAVARGDADAFGELFNAYKDKVYSYAMHFTHEAEVARDLTQEVFLSVWTNRAGLAAVERFEAWVFMATRNRCFNQLRKMAREAERNAIFARLPESGQAGPEEHLMVKEYDRLHREAIERLPDQQRRVYTLYAENQNIDELARELALARTTVRSHLAMARRSVRSYIQASLELTLLLLWINS